MNYPRSKHSYPDSDLINATALRAYLDVSAPAISKATTNGRLDTYENSKGKRMYHRILSVRQFRENRDRRHVTTPTQGQKRMGFDNLTAQAVAHDSSFDIPDESLWGDSASLEDALVKRDGLAVAKQEKEVQLARLAKLKADELEGRLVDKAKVAIKVYQIGANVQEKIMTVYSWLAPEIVGYFRNLMVSSGIENQKVIDLTADSSHEIGEKIRKACLLALKDLTDKKEDDILDG
jgi:hypothetical protein